MEKLQKSGLSLKNFTYTNKKIADDIYEAINSTSFLGVSVSTALSLYVFLLSRVLLLIKINIQCMSNFCQN